MTPIDFRPSWYRAKFRRKRETMIRLTILGVLAAELTLGSVGTFTQKAVARQEVAKMQAALSDQEEALHHLGRRQVELDELHQKNRLLSDVSGGVAVHEILAELSGLLPNAAVVTELRLVQTRRIEDVVPAVHGASRGPIAEKEQGALEITGWASTNINVGMFMANLSASVLFHNTQLQYSNPATMNGRAGREFKLTCLFPQCD